MKDSTYTTYKWKTTFLYVPVLLKWLSKRIPDNSGRQFPSRYLAYPNNFPQMTFRPGQFPSRSHYDVDQSRHYIKVIVWIPTQMLLLGLKWVEIDRGAGANIFIMLSLLKWLASIRPLCSYAHMIILLKRLLVEGRVYSTLRSHQVNCWKDSLVNRRAMYMTQL